MQNSQAQQIKASSTIHSHSTFDKFVLPDYTILLHRDLEQIDYIVATNWLS